MSKRPEKEGSAPDQEGAPETLTYIPGRAVNFVGRAWEDGERHRVIFPPTDDERDEALGFFDPEAAEAQMSDRKLRAQKVRAVAIRFVLGMEPASMEEKAAELGVTRAAISRVCVEVAERLGLNYASKSKEHRIHTSESVRRSWTRRHRGAPSVNSGTTPEEKIAV